SDRRLGAAPTVLHGEVGAATMNGVPVQIIVAAAVRAARRKMMHIGPAVLDDAVAGTDDVDAHIRLIVSVGVGLIEAADRHEGLAAKAHVRAHDAVVPDTVGGILV